MLAQGGEFAFVALGIAQKLGLVGGEVARLVLTVTALSMAATPFLAEGASMIGNALEARESVVASKEKTDKELDAALEESTLSREVVVCGYGRVGRVVADLLNEKLIPWVAFDVNPKSIRTDELYGYISMATREWKDGLLSNIMRSVGGIPDEQPKWIMLDGDLDANWIESMNSVMDDNRMLTLASNERIPLKPHMRLVFEIRDLKHATPATVSRAGILYISTADGTQWRSLIKAWLLKRGDEEEARDTLTTCFETYVGPTLFWMKINVQPVLVLEEMSFVQSLLFMLDCMLTNEKAMETPESIETVFVFCAIWAFGSALTVSDDGTDYKKIFSDWWRSEWKNVKFPSRETVFEYWLDPDAMSFDQLAGLAPALQTLQLPALEKS